MTFSWDPEKNEANYRKHRISLETAQYVFDDPHYITDQDRYVGGEERWQTIGTVDGRTLLLVAHTWIDAEDENQEEHIRIISAREANRAERQKYERNS